MEQLYNLIQTNDITKYIHKYKPGTALIIIKYPQELVTYEVTYYQVWDPQAIRLIKHLNYNIEDNEEEEFCNWCLSNQERCFTLIDFQEDSSLSLCSGCLDSYQKQRSSRSQFIPNFHRNGAGLQRPDTAVQT